MRIVFGLDACCLFPQHVLPIIPDKGCAAVWPSRTPREAGAPGRVTPGGGSSSCPPLESKMAAGTPVPTPGLVEVVPCLRERARGERSPSGNPTPPLALLLLFSCSVVSNSLWPHGLQHPRYPCPSPFPRACSNSCPLRLWCHPIISSSGIPLSSCLQSFPASGSFLMKRPPSHQVARVLELQLQHQSFQWMFRIDFL